MQYNSVGVVVGLALHMEYRRCHITYFIDDVLNVSTFALTFCNDKLKFDNTDVEQPNSDFGISFMDYGFSQIQKKFTPLYTIFKCSFDINFIAESEENAVWISCHNTGISILPYTKDSYINEMSRLETRKKLLGKAMGKFVFNLHYSFDELLQKRNEYSDKVMIIENIQQI